MTSLVAISDNGSPESVSKTMKWTTLHKVKSSWLAATKVSKTVKERVVERPGDDDDDNGCYDIHRSPWSWKTLMEVPPCWLAHFQPVKLITPCDLAAIANVVAGFFSPSKHLRHCLPFKVLTENFKGTLNAEIVFFSFRYCTSPRSVLYLHNHRLMFLIDNRLHDFIKNIHQSVVIQDFFRVESIFFYQ